MMINEFIDYITENQIIDRHEKILLAVSGGIDSVVLLHLLVKSGYTCTIAHCNFRLRGEESDGDELFVRDLAGKYDTGIHVRSFETEDYSREKGISIQMAARELRYEWFGLLCRENGYDLIATAHNMDDVIETFFINLVRGTGIRGLTGIKPRSGNLIRPLLFAARDAISKYAEAQDIHYREDSSNAEIKYTRNKIRHGIMPLLQEINPGVRQGLIDTIEKLRYPGIIYEQALEDHRKDMVSDHEGLTFIDLQKLAPIADRKTLLYEFISCFNFSSGSITDIEKCLDGPSGKQFFSGTHRLVKDRNRLIISPLQQDNPVKYYVEDGMTGVDEPLPMDFMTVNRTPQFQIPADRDAACLDHARLIFPLILRKWQPGDYFYPLGMQHLKKISDFFIDEKFSLVDKENTWLLLSGEHIAWVVGHRIDNRYKITDKTGQVFFAKLRK
jgi:tRNA(Ile)-lysidine synthase